MAVDNKNTVTLLIYASFLEANKDYSKAIVLLKRINLVKETPKQVVFIYFSLGRLSYRLRKKNQGRKYFELGFKYYSGHADLARLNAAKHILAVNPYSEDAINFLKEIAQNSPGSQQALQLLSLNVNSEQHYLLHNDANNTEQKNLELLNQGIYHKIQNEISILKATTRRIAAKNEAVQLADIIVHIEGISEEIVKQRNKAQIESNKKYNKNYQHILRVIEKTAHDIADFVNNEVAVIKGDVQRILKKQQLEEKLTNKLNDLLEQIEFTETALNDLKAVNQSVELRNTSFLVEKLFDNWKKNPVLHHAQINLDIINGDSILYGDEQKIKGFFNELIDNALKHNPSQKDLIIEINTKNLAKLPQYLLKSKAIPDKKYLVITVSDNGKGVPKEKKDWIFLPLKTTSKEGSGLGLFMIKKTVQAMRGYIVECGNNGCRYEIYLPYGAEQWQR